MAEFDQDKQAASWLTRQRRRHIKFLLRYEEGHPARKHHKRAIRIVDHLLSRLAVPTKEGSDG